MKVGFGCDHTAIDLKKELMEYMTEKGYECVDYGAYDAKVRVDYPDQGQKVAEAIIAGEEQQSKSTDEFSFAKLSSRYLFQPK